MPRRFASAVALALASWCASSLAGCKGSSGAAPPPPPPPPPPPAAELVTFMTAEAVLGQADFASASPDRGGTPSLAGVRFPAGDALALADRLVLPDTFNHRLLVYAAWPASGSPADQVLGQPDAASASPAHAPGRFHYPRSVGSDGASLLVADTAASRVVVGAGAAEVALGWAADAPVHRWGCAADRLSEPTRAVVSGGRLVVADRGNHRVLVWNGLPAPGVPPDLVLGQRDLTHCAPDDMLGAGVSGGRSARTLRDPTDVWTDGTRLLVVDQGNHRVLLWTSFPTSNAAPADLVLGQADFLVAAAQTTRAGLRWPGAVASDGTRILVADTRNHRVLVWRSFPSANGQPADLVLGQGDFTHGAPNDDDQDGATDGPSARTLYHPLGVALAGDRLVVTDSYNHRFLVFRGR